MGIWNKTYKQDSDEYLMRQITHGNAQAFNELYCRYKDRLYYYFFRMLGNSESLAEDFLQDIFYKIIDKPELFNPERKFSTWIFSVANNMCKNEYRRMDVRDNTKHILDIETTEFPQYEVTDQSKITELIFRVIQTLSEEHQSSFILFYREEFSIEQISSMLKISPGTVKSRLFNARKKVRAKLEKDYPEIMKEVCYAF